MEDKLTKAVEKYEENLGFLKSLNSVPKKSLQSRLYPIHDEVFAKTNCLDCANCCKSSPPRVTNEDINRISKHLGISKKQFKRKYILEDVDDSMSFINVPCSFLGSDNKCSIYENRPQACHNYPHTRQQGFSSRGKLNAQNTLVCPAAFDIVERLKEIY